MVVVAVVIVVVIVVVVIVVIVVAAAAKLQTSTMHNVNKFTKIHPYFKYIYIKLYIVLIT